MNPDLLTESVIRIARAVLLALPALIVVLCVCGIWFIALWLNEARQRYALQAAGQAIEWARILVGSSTKPPPKRVPRKPR